MLFSLLLNIISIISELPWILLPVGLLLLTASWWLGRLVSFLLNDEAFDQHIAIGTVLMTACTAAVFTRFKTIFLLVVLSGLLLMWFRRNAFKKEVLFVKRPHFKELAILFSYFCIFFLLQAFINYRGASHWAVNYIDNYAYIAQINWMYSDGLETRYLEFEKSRYGFEAFLKPYHYFENWPAVLAKAISGQLGYFVFNLFLIPFLSAILLFQNRQLLLKHFKVLPMYAFLVPLAVFTTLRFTLVDEWVFDILRSIGIQTAYSKFIFFQNLGWWHFFSYLYGLKLLVSGIFISPILYHFLQRNFKVLCTYVALLPLASLIYIPLAMVTIGGAVLQKISRLKSAYTYLPFLSIFWVWLFYKMFDRDDVAPFAVDLFAALKYRLEFLLTKPLVFAFQTLTELFGNYYWLLLPLLIWLVSTAATHWRLRLLAGWVALYPLTGLSFDLLFKVFMAGWVLTTVLCLWHYRNKFLQYHVHTAVLFYLGFKVFNTLLGDVYDFHQIYALTVPVTVYAGVVMLWGLMLRHFSVNSLFLKAVLLFIVSSNMLAIHAENVRSFKPGKVDNAFYQKVFGKLAPDGKIKSVYYSAFTLMPYIHYDRVGDELLQYTDDFTTTLFAIDLFTAADTAAAEKMGARGFFDALPIARYLKKSGYNGGDLAPYKLRFLKENQVEFVLRRLDYPREKLRYLQPFITDSAYNRQLEYQIFQLKFE
jgi:hypothetical protein